MDTAFPGCAAEVPAGKGLSPRAGIFKDIGSYLQAAGIPGWAQPMYRGAVGTGSALPGSDTPITCECGGPPWQRVFGHRLRPRHHRGSMFRHSPAGMLRIARSIQQFSSSCLRSCRTATADTGVCQTSSYGPPLSLPERSLLFDIRVNFRNISGETGSSHQKILIDHGTDI
ncbi:hypothetical protein ASZ90_008907 [hydrocarbon metagenome]|uniref:Uncharacterized protein n=1 Tax=hydrocarbon metagenome TaxID=938273 RepID=A0A0W8FKC4_9ZZZZ